MGIIAEIHRDLDRGALQLMAEYRGRLFGEAVNLCADKALAEDLVFRTLERALDRVDTYKEDNNLFAWMKSIMENIHKDDMKRPVPRGTAAVESDELERHAGADNSTDEQILRNSDEEAVRKALRHIDPEFRQLVLMRYYEELSLKEIAGFLNKPVCTVSRRIQIALRLLAGKLEAEFDKAKKPLAILLAALLGVGTLFGAWVSPLGDWVSEKVFGSAPAETSEVAQADIEPAVEEGVAITPAPAPQADADVISETQKQKGEDNMNISAKVKKTVAVATVAALTLTSAVLPTASAAEAEGVSYTLLEWIRTTPSRGFAQYIDTGVYPDVGIETHFVFKREENCPEQRFFGVQYWGNVNGQVYYSFNFGPDWGTACLGMMYFRREVFGSRQSFSGLNVKEKTTIDFSDKLFLNGVCVWTNTFENVDFSGSQHAHLRIGQDVNDTSTQMTVYECRISKDGVDLCDLWPCKMVDAGGNEWYGVYDFANQKFIGNSAAPNDVAKTYVGGPVDEKFKIKYRKSSGRYERVSVQKGMFILLY